MENLNDKLLVKMVNCWCCPLKAECNVEKKLYESEALVTTMPKDKRQCPLYKLLKK